MNIAHMDPSSSPSKTWTIVKFKEDCTVSAVPTTWITDTGDCLWPPFTADKIASAIKNHVTNTCWPTFKIDVFRNATYDNYDTARLKSIRAEDTSDLNTEDERPKRRRIFKKNYSSSSGENSDDQDILRTPPKIKKNKGPAKNLMNNTPVAQKAASLPFTNHINSSVMTGNFSHLTPRINKDFTSENVNSPVMTGTVTHLLTPARNDHFTDLNADKGNCTCCPHHAQVEYLKHILNQQNFIKSILSDLLVEVRSTKNSNEVLDENDSIFKKFNMPIKTDDDIELLNNYLKDEGNFTKAVTEICKIGGKDNYEFVKRCMGMLICNKYAMQYSWLGRREKKSFCNFEVAKLIINAADKAKKAKDLQETEASLKNWLRRARDRQNKIGI